jgi:glucose/arabinose dehydrogenase
MKLKICLIVAMAIGAAQAESRQTAPKKASEKKKPAPVPAEVTIPAGATQVEPGTYTFTDAQGKKWIYRKTPFGIARAEDKPAEAVSAPASGAAITAAEDGDNIRFERSGPFGTYRWQKKKSDLSDDERAAWERSSGKDAAASKAKQE